MARGGQAQPKEKVEAPKKSDKKRLPSVHISNLPSKFYDLDLFKLIKTKSFDVVKAVVVRDKNSSKSLNYGYAQFKKQEDAVACQKALNNLEVEGKLTIWSLVVLDQKPNPKANIIVRNLASTITQKQVHDYFLKFGAILKCKLECFADERSRGFAYVQFETEENAQEAVKQSNGVDLEGKKLEVFIHIKRENETKDTKDQKTPAAQSNNVFVQGLTKGTTEAQLNELFAEFGEIVSSTVNKVDSDDTISNTGFVCFKDASSANLAIEKLNKHKLSDGNYLLVQYHVAKRQNDLTQDKTKTTITQNINKNF